MLNLEADVDRVCSLQVVYHIHLGARGLKQGVGTFMTNARWLQ